MFGMKIITFQAFECGLSYSDRQSRDCQHQCSKGCVGPTVVRPELNYHVSFRTDSVHLGAAVCVSHSAGSESLPAIAAAGGSVNRRRASV